MRFPDPGYFGHRGSSRFDAPNGEFGVCYFGTSLDCCLVEVLSAEREPDSGRLLLATTRLSEFYASVARLGIDQRVTGGDDYNLSQRWAAAIHGHASMVDGIFYATRHHNQLYAVALFERARDAVQFERWGVLGDRSVGDLSTDTDRLLVRFGITLLEEA